MPRGPVDRGVAPGGIGAASSARMSSGGRSPSGNVRTSSKVSYSSITPKPMKVSKAKQAKLLKDTKKPTKSFGAKSDRASKERIANSPHPNGRKRYEEVTRQFKLQDARQQAFNSGKVKKMLKKGV